MTSMHERGNDGGGGGGGCGDLRARQTLRPCARKPNRHADLGSVEKRFDVCKVGVVYWISFVKKGAYPVENRVSCTGGSWIACLAGAERGAKGHFLYVFSASLVGRRLNRVARNTNT